jgi:HD-GYP domain-containing protein (c-di-GMP phosphodiesterase class II)
MRFADGALFWAKAHGRDMTFRYSPEVVTELSAAEQLEHLRRTRTIVGIRALARAVDVKDHSTARHSERVADMATAIARILSGDERALNDLHEAAFVHDVGKIGVPDAIPLKPSRLDPEEYEEIKRHPSLSAEIVDDVLSDEQVAWVLGHHERFDGRGYPVGLTGESIPTGARILAVADAWDVMTSERPYSAARSPQDALSEIRARAVRSSARPS